MRIRKRRLTKGFTVVKNVWVNDKRLSAKAKGIMIYLCYLPEDWALYASELENHFTDGRDSIKTGLVELMKFGYLKREDSKRNKTNPYRSYDYILIEDPNSDNGADEVYYNEREDGCGKSASENPHLPNKDTAGSFQTPAVEQIEKEITNKQHFYDWCMKNVTRKEVFLSKDKNYAYLVNVWKQEYTEEMKEKALPVVKDTPQPEIKENIDPTIDEIAAAFQE